jgi:serine/threonine protein kinase
MAHGDLKPDNIMFADDFSLQLIDFGHSAPMGTLITREIGTRGYRAPEVSKYTPFLISQTDIYSLACTLFAIMFQTMPFSCTTVDRQQFFELYKKQETMSQFFEIHYNNFFPTDERHPESALRLIY